MSRNKRIHNKIKTFGDYLKENYTGLEGFTQVGSFDHHQDKQADRFMDKAKKRFPQTYDGNIYPNNEYDKIHIGSRVRVLQNSDVPKDMVGKTGYVEGSYRGLYSIAFDQVIHNVEDYDTLRSYELRRDQFEVIDDFTDASTQSYDSGHDFHADVIDVRNELEDDLEDDDFEDYDNDYDSDPEEPDYRDDDMDGLDDDPEDLEYEEDEDDYDWETGNMFRDASDGTITFGEDEVYGKSESKTNEMANPMKDDIKTIANMYYRKGYDVDIDRNHQSLEIQDGKGNIVFSDQGDGFEKIMRDAKKASRKFGVEVEDAVLWTLDSAGAISESKKKEYDLKYINEDVGRTGKKISNKREFFAYVHDLLGDAISSDDEYDPDEANKMAKDLWKKANGDPSKAVGMAQQSVGF